MKYYVLFPSLLSGNGAVANMPSCPIDVLEKCAVKLFNPRKFEYYDLNIKVT